MKTLERLIRPEFGWFDLVFIIIAFTLTRDLALPALPQMACFFVIGFVIGAERVLLCPFIARKRAVKP